MAEHQIRIPKTGRLNRAEALAKAKEQAAAEGLILDGHETRLEQVAPGKYEYVVTFKI